MEQKDSLRIELIGVADISSLAEFLKKEYPDGEIADEQYLKWEYTANPFGSAYVCCALTEQSDIAAQYALIPLEVVMDGRIYKAALSLNTMTAEKYRGRGLFTQTAEASLSACAERDVVFTVGIPNANSFQGFIKKLKFRHCGNLSLTIKPLRVFNIMKSMMPWRRVKKGGEIGLVLNEEALSNKGVSFFDPSDEHSLYEPFWSEWKRTSRIVVNRSTAYLSWRYLQNPMRKYHMLKITENGQMKGMAIFRALNVFGLRTCVLMDFFSLDLKSGLNLIDSIMVEMKKNDMDIIIAANAGTRVAIASIRQAGFIKVPEMMLPQQLPFIIRCHRSLSNTISPNDLENWHFTFGDYDVF